MPTIEEYGIEMITADYNGRAPAGWGDGARRWHVVLRCEDRTMEVDYKTGSAITEITGEDVLGCLLSDASCVYSSPTFEDFCDNLGYDRYDDEGDENRGARRTFDACIKQTVELEALVGGQDRVEELGEAWQDW